VSVYFIQSGYSGYIKIGSSADPQARLATLQTGASIKLRLLAVIPGGINEERALHSELASLRVMGEWFQNAAEIHAVMGNAALDQPHRIGASLKQWRDFTSDDLNRMGREAWETRVSSDDHRDYDDFAPFHAKWRPRLLRFPTVGEFAATG
jgi:hypothetical protein